jgi:polysaccharide export outer membrane protein
MYNLRLLNANIRGVGFLILVVLGGWLNIGKALADGAGQTNNASYQAGLSQTNILMGSRHLQPNDVLEVTVYQEPDLATKVTLDDRGMVALPLIGPVKLAGLTLEQATAKIRDLYDKDYLVNPKVTIQVDQMAVLRFTVLGQVQRPGSYEFPPNESLNLLEGLAMAGGYTRLAAPSKITLQRNVNGELKVFHLDADAMARDKNNKPFQLLPDDTVTVEERVF